MSDELKPALSAEEWAQSGEYGQRLWTFDNGVQVAIPDAGGAEVNWDGAVYDSRMQALGDKHLAVIALLNHALPNDSPYKITRADAHDCLVGAVFIRQHADDGSALRRLADKLFAILPPETP